jgi:hypothetical protein
MKKSLVVLALLVTTILHAQNIEFKNYEWSDTVSISKIPESMKKENSVIIFEKRTYEYAFNSMGMLEEYMLIHKKIKVLQEKGIEDNNKLYVSAYSPDEVLTFKARVISPDNKKTEMFKGDTKMVNEDGSNYMVLAVEGLTVGCDLEYFFIKQINVNSFHTFRFQDQKNRLKTEFTLISPKSLTFKSKSYNGLPAIKDSLVDKKRFYALKLGLIEAMEEEKYSAYDASVMRVEMKISQNLDAGNAELYTWSGAASKIYKNVHEENTEESKDVKKVLKQFKCTDNECLIREIEGYIKTNFNIQETGESEDVAATFKRKYGSSMAIIRLYARFFEQAAIPYELVLGVDKFSARFDPTFETWQYLDEYLFYFPKLQKYLTPTNYSYRLGFYPGGLMLTDALFIKELGIGDTKTALGKIQKIGEIMMDKSYNNLDVSMDLDVKTLKTKIKATHTSNGFMAADVRAYYFYATLEDRLKYSEDVFKYGIKDAVLSNLEVKGYDLSKGETETDFVLSADVESSVLIEKAGGDIIVKMGELIGEQSEMYQDKDRKMDIELENTHSYTRKLVFNVPAGYDVKGVETFNFASEFENKDGRKSGFVSSAKIVDGKVIIDVREYYASLFYPKSLFDPYKKVINSAADFNKLSLILVKKK